MDLYKLELVKIRLTPYLWAIFILFACMQAFGIFSLFLGSISEETELFTTWDGLLAMQSAMEVGFFSVFSAVIASKVIVSEYCGINALTLFTYPVKRRKILSVKCMLVLLVTAVPAFASSILGMTGMYITSLLFNITPVTPGMYFAFEIVLSSFFAGIISSAAGIISSVAGWKKRSVISTVICGLVIVCFVPNLIAAVPGSTVLTMFTMCIVFTLVSIIMYGNLANGIEEMEV